MEHMQNLTWKTIFNKDWYRSDVIVNKRHPCYAASFFSHEVNEKVNTLNRSYYYKMILGGLFQIEFLVIKNKVWSLLIKYIFCHLG